MNNDKTYTKTQLDVALLKQKNDGFYNLMSDIKSDIRELRTYVIGLYAVIGAAALAKILGVL